MSRAQRFGIRIGRGWAALLLAAGVLLLVGYWIGPLRPLPARLELLAVDGDAAVTEVRAQPRRTADGTLAFAVPLAVRNVGAEATRPRRLVLNVPAQYRVMSMRGRLTGEVSAGLPLRRYVVELPAQELAPSEATSVLAGLDTIFLEPDLPRYYCAIQGLQVPEFTPAPRYDARTISDVRIFYSFWTARSDERHTGLLTVQLDPSLLQVAPAAMPPTFRTVLEEPEARVPDLGVMSFAGARAATCGDPEQPVQLYTVIWENRAGARLFVIFIDGEPRKRLYDLDRDGIVDLETWDASGDGRFEARRDARYAVPEFLLPLPPRDPSMIAPDPQRPDSAWLALFNTYSSGPARFARSSLVAHPQVAVADTLPADTTAPRDVEAGLGAVRPATPEFLALFADTLAGPFRFAPRRAQPQPAQVEPAPTPTQPGTVPVQPQRAETTPDTQATPATPPADTAPPRPTPPRRRPPLGVPVDQR